MVLGMSLATFTLSHVIISLIGIGSGLALMYGFLKGYRLDGLTAVFLVTTALTRITGFFFPFTQLLPSHKVGIISLVLLAVAISARSVLHLAGPWRFTSCCDGGDGAVSQLLRTGRTTVHEASRSKGSDPDARRKRSRRSCSPSLLFWPCLWALRSWRQNHSVFHRPLRPNWDQAG